MLTGRLSASATDAKGPAVPQGRFKALVSDAKGYLALFGLDARRTGQKGCYGMSWDKTGLPSPEACCY